MGVEATPTVLRFKLKCESFWKEEFPKENRHTSKILPQNMHVRSEKEANVEIWGNYKLKRWVWRGTLGEVASMEPRWPHGMGAGKVMMCHWGGDLMSKGVLSRVVLTRDINPNALDAMGQDNTCPSSGHA